jgi:hypothetical protein
VSASCKIKMNRAPVLTLWAEQGILARSGRLFTASTLGQFVRQGTVADSFAS